MLTAADLAHAAIDTYVINNAWTRTETPSLTEHTYRRGAVEITVWWDQAGTFMRGYLTEDGGAVRSFLSEAPAEVAAWFEEPPVPGLTFDAAPDSPAWNAAVEAAIEVLRESGVDVGTPAARLVGPAEVAGDTVQGLVMAGYLRALKDVRGGCVDVDLLSREAPTD